MREIIAVTQADIEGGCASDPYCCPVAQALKRQHPGGYPAVGRFSMQVRWRDEADRVIAATPSLKLERWIRRFDLGKPVQPTRFAVVWEE